MRQQQGNQFGAQCSSQECEREERQLVCREQTDTEGEEDIHLAAGCPLSGGQAMCRQSSQEVLASPSEEETSNF